MMVLGTLSGAGLQEGRVGGILFLWNISFSEHSSPVSHQVKIHFMLRVEGPHICTSFVLYY